MSRLRATSRFRHPPPGARRGDSGVTVIELLSVIAVIAILAAIIIPTTRGAFNAANKGKARTQFSQWGAAFEQFRQEYGTYPQFSTNGALKVVNPTGTSTATTGTHLFHDVLAGKRRDGQALVAVTGNAQPPAAVQQNPRRISFVSFTDSDFVLQADVTAGRALANVQNYIRDPFFNTSIAVITDSNLDGVINGRDVSPYPAVTIAGNTTTIRPTTIVTTAVTGGIHAGVIFYSAPPGATTENDLITSWR